MCRISPDPRERVQFEIVLLQSSWNIRRETFAPCQTGLLCKGMRLFSMCTSFGFNQYWWGIVKVGSKIPWLVLFNLSSKLDLSNCDCILAFKCEFKKSSTKNEGFPTFGFFIPFSDVVEGGFSLLGGLEELQAPSSTSCSRIGLFLQSGSPDCEWREKGNWTCLSKLRYI